MKRYIRVALQVLIAYLIFSILSEYLSSYVVIGILLGIVILFTLYGNRGRDNYMYYLDSACDVNKYLEYVNVKLQNKDQSKYLLYLSYGNLYNGDFENLEENIRKIDTSKFNLKEKFLYEELQLKLLYNNKDTEGYENKLNEISLGMFNNTYNNKLSIMKAPLLMLKEEYTELVDMMFELIPKQRQSYRVIELEYYLSVAYIALDKEEDAIAVLEFVTKRDFKLDHVVKGKALLEQLQSN